MYEGVIVSGADYSSVLGEGVEGRGAVGVENETPQASIGVGNRMGMMLAHFQPHRTLLVE